ncbi:hypothetical protein EKK58_12100 [Candidatus Dependentiae bacterium]|nr:MAG: hypothetical protein EKK58_12100 [Candidatus Dependentiae bacterium]
MKIILNRNNYAPTYTLGFIRYKDFFCFTLEPAKTQGKGCIPCGVYPIVWEYSPKFKRELWELKNVPNFTEIKIHAGNTVDHTQGCILLGLDAETGDESIFHSGLAVEMFNELCHKEDITEIEVREV